MAKVKIQGHASGSGVFTITAPNSNTDRTITLPDASVTLGTDATKLPLAGGAMTGAITTNSTFDGVDVAAASVLASAALPKGGGTMSGEIVLNSTNLTCGDSTSNANKIRMGASDDLNIHHDGSNSYIEDSGTGALRILGSSIELRNAPSDNELMLKATVDGSVELYHNNVKKLETTANGILATGKINVGTNTATSILNVSSTDTSNFAVTINGARASGGAGNMVDFHENSFGGNRIGTITSSGSAISYNTSSDYRLKENVDYTWDATTRLKQLKPARFNFIADEDNTLVDGFIAHEVSAIVPEAIIGAKDAVDDDDNPVHQGIDQSKLVPLLVKTIQELEARITALEA